MRCPTLAGERVVLRPWVVGDAGWYVGARDDEVARWTTEPPDLTVDAVEQAIMAAPDRPDRWSFAIADAVTGELLGNLPVSVEAGVAVIGYWLAPSARGRGIAAEALEVVRSWLASSGVADIARLEIDPDNVASIRTAARAGFERTTVPGEDGRVRFERVLR